MQGSRLCCGDAHGYGKISETSVKIIYACKKSHFSAIIVAIRFKFATKVPEALLF